MTVAFSCTNISIGLNGGGLLYTFPVQSQKHQKFRVYVHVGWTNLVSLISHVALRRGVELDMSSLDLVNHWHLYRLGPSELYAHLEGEATLIRMRDYDSNVMSGQVLPTHRVSFCVEANNNCWGGLLCGELETGKGRNGKRGRAISTGRRSRKWCRGERGLAHIGRPT